MLLPYAGLSVVGGSGTLSLTTTALLMSLWVTVTQGITDEISAAEVQADLANNRILVATPGIYEVVADLYGTNDTASDVVLTLRKNAVAQTDVRGIARMSTAGTFRVGLAGIVKVSGTDNPKTIAASGDSTSLTGAGKQPKIMCPLDLTVAVLASTATLTVTDGRFLVKRLG